MHDLLHHATVPHHQNPVSVHDGGKPMRDHDRRAALRQTRHLYGDCPLCACIRRGPRSMNSSSFAARAARTTSAREADCIKVFRQHSREFGLMLP
jgi:hypothetical protein